MTAREKEQKLITRYEILPGPQERLNALVEEYGKTPSLLEEERQESNRVHGCQSRVYVVGTLTTGGLCHFRYEADSLLVKGLVALICEVYEGATPEQVIQMETEILPRLGIWGILSPTRQNGMNHLRQVIREWAAQQL